MGTTTITGYLAQATDFIQTFSLDFIIIVVTLAALFTLSMHLGKGAIITLIFSFYVGLLTYLHFPYIERFLFFTENETQLFLSNAAIFLAFVIISYVTLSRVVYADFSEGAPERIFEAGLLSAAATLLLLSFSYQILPVTTLYNFSESVDLLFEPSNLFFLWLVIPLAIVILTTRR